MRRLSGLGVILASSLIAACGSSSSPPPVFDGGAGVAGGGGKGGAAAGATGQGGGAGGQPAGGAGGQPAGGAGGQPAGGAGGQPAGGAGGQPAGGAGGQSLGGAGGQPLGGAGGQPLGGGGGHASGCAGGQSAGGAGGQPVGGGGGHASGGAGGQPAGGAGGQSLGGATGACLDPSSFSAAFTIADSTFCAVAVYTAPESIGYQAPTWGSHGGPLVVQQSTGTGVTLERWTAPAGTTGTMTVQTTPVAAALPTGDFLGAQALDLPFFGWTAISWTATDFTGQFEMIASGAIVTTYTANGPYGAAAVPAASSQGRFLFSGLSPLGMPTINMNGLYAADACSSPAPALGAGTGCTASSLVSAWGDSSGPVATDSDGDVFAVMTSFAGTQEARGFLASSVARGAAATAGVSLFTMAGSSVSLAALSPTAGDPGLVIFQPQDSTYTPLDVIEQKFTASGSLVAMGTPTKLLTVAPGQGLAFLVDGSERLWVAVSGTSSTTYVVLARQ
ncbi:MAG TPA: hypothetical protein VLA79_05560 [Polyangia bacterium]|nr:hypothetical protein [Polyangia bacterium]